MAGVIEIAPARVLNAVGASAAERQLAVVAEGASIPLTYGVDRLGALVLNVVPSGSRVLIQCLWGFAVTAIAATQLNGAPLPAGATATHYTGAQTTVDPTLAAAFAALSPAIVYTDTLNGFAYSVLSLPLAEFSGGLQVSAEITGRALYDPRLDSTNGGSGPQRLADPATWAWSDNPSLALADFARSTLYGAGRSVDWPSVIAVADWNDTDLGGEKHRTLNWSLTRAAPVASVLETLRTYAGVFLPRRGATLYLVPDKATAASATYAHAAGEIASYGDMIKRDLGDAPTVVEVAYTDTTQVPYRELIASAPLAGVDAGTLPLRVSRITLNGINRYSQARREAIERVNKLALADLSLAVTVFDIGIRHEPGDVITLSLPTGVTAKDFRVGDVAGAGAGLWEMSLVEFDPAVYSSVIETQPTFPDTTLPNPSAPPAVTSVTVSEELFQQLDGSWNSRLRVSIAAPSFAFFASYRIEVYDNLGALIDAATTLQPSYASPPLREGISYTIRAQMISVTGAAGAWAQTAQTFTGKLAPPSDVTGLTGYEAGGEVFLSWSPAFDLDLRGYEVRYGSTSATWASATLLDRVFALKLRSKGVLAAGVVRLFVKAFDSLGGESANAATIDVTVTIDPDSLATEYRPSNPALSGMITISERDGSTYDITQVGAATFGTQFSAALATYTDPISAYWAGASSWEGDNTDPWGVQLTGDWDCESQHVAISGSVAKALRLSADNISFTDYTTLPTKQTARYARVKLSTTGTMKVLRGTQRVFVNAVVRKEFGNDTSSASAGKTINLAGKYFTWRRFNIEPYFAGSAAARSHNIDNIVLSASGANSFDVNVYDSAGNRVAQNFNWTFEGV